MKKMEFYFAFNVSPLLFSGCLKTVTVLLLPPVCLSLFTCTLWNSSWVLLFAKFPLQCYSVPLRYQMLVSVVMCKWNSIFFDWRKWGKISKISFNCFSLDLQKTYWFSGVVTSCPVSRINRFLLWFWCSVTYFFSNVTRLPVFWRW